MSRFDFKQFSVDDQDCGMKVSTDAVLLGAWCDMPARGPIFDLGAGSGILALMCAQRFPDAKITAIEIDSSAVKAAQDNFALSPWASRLQAICCDALEWEPSVRPALIISNPPYFTNGLVSPTQARAAARHGMGLIPETAIQLAAKWLAPNGSLAMITPADAKGHLTYIAEVNKLKLRRLCQVSTVPGKSPNRLLWQWSREDGPLELQTLCLRNCDGKYSQEYINLTSDFYLRLS